MLNRKIEMENEGTETEIKNEIKVQTKYWHECWHCSCQQSTKIKSKLSRKIQIDNEATENELKIKLKLKQNNGISVHIAVIDTTQK